ncbi:MAG TPA: caspase family protein, partial [Rubrivivax sp.]|nr:caspase family protein [Rubrivivax sp.]
ATLSGGTLGNLVAGETLGIALSGGLFDTSDVGAGKPVTGTAALQDGSARASNYALPDGALALSASITPRPLTLSAVVAADKVYDGTRTATLSGGTLGNLVAGETLGLGYAGALFDTADVGAGKLVSGAVALSDGLGRASNYRLSAGVATARASIEPATLTYLADPVTAFRGLLPSVYTGSVGGFVGEETLSGATTGSLRFRALAADDAAAGVYPIEGGGLLAGNYVFVQAPSNATALTVVDPAAANEVAEVMLAVRSDPLLPPATGAVSRVFDATPALRPAAGGGFSFATLDIDVLPAASVSALLQAREMYMRDVWQAGMAQLDADPTLADMKPCESARQAASGVCLVTDEIVAAAQGSAQEATQGAADARSTLAALPTPTAAPVAAPPTAPRPSSGPQATGAAAPSSAAAAAASAPVPSGGPSTVASAPTAAAAQPQLSTPAAAIPSEPPPATVRPSAQPVLQPPPLPPARAVSTAALPQIRRKFAVLFGNDNYKDASVPSLDNAGRDVDAMARVLESRLGYETLVVHDAGRRAMVGALNRLALAARPDDSVVVYYAGHGTVSEVNGRGYWIPADADASRPQSWLANADIERLMSRIRASQVVLVADSCFSGTLVGAPRRAASPDTLDIDTLLRRRTEVVMSSGGNEPVADGGRNGHSPFAASLMQALESLDAWRPGSSIYQRVRADVTRRIPQTPQYGPMRRGQDAAGGDYVFEQRQLAAQR